MASIALSTGAHDAGARRAGRCASARPRGDRAGRKLFAFSILYLFLLFAALLVDAAWRLSA